MNRIKSLILCSAAVLSAFGCKPEEKAPVKEPSAPQIVSACLTGTGGETKIRVGKPVTFKAEVKVENSNLDTYVIEVMNGDVLLASSEGTLEGSEAVLEKELSLNINKSTFDAEMTPTVYFKVTNTDDQYTEMNLSRENIVTICPPNLLPQMYLVDSYGDVYELTEMAQKGRFRTHDDIEDIGGSFTICEQIEGSNTPSGQKWEYTTPKSIYGLSYIGFDAIDEEMFWMIDDSVILDATKMDNDGGFKVYWNMSLTQNCKVIFKNFSDGMLLQSDRFADVENNTARYTGHDGEKFEIYYMHDDKTNWMTIKGQYNDSEVLWITGDGASAPMVPYCEGHEMNWFATNPDCAYSALSMVREGTNTFSALMYMKSGFNIKLYDYWSWNNELDWTSTSPETLVITGRTADPETGKVDGNYGTPGPAFSEGLWLLTYNKLTKEASLKRYDGRIADAVTGMGGGEPVTPPVGPVVPDVSDLYLVTDAGAAKEMVSVGGTRFITRDASVIKAGASFYLAQKVDGEGKIDWSGKVWGMKDGKVAAVQQGGDRIPVDACYSDRDPWKVGFDSASCEVIYRESVNINAMTEENAGGVRNLWVLPLPHGCELYITNAGSNKISEMLDKSVFDSFNDDLCCAKYNGASARYEVHYRPQQGWMMLRCLDAGHQFHLIGKNAAFGQVPYLGCKMIETDLDKVAGHYVPLNHISESQYGAYIYLDSDSSFQIYSDFTWASQISDWTSATPAIASKAEGQGYSVAGKDFYPGLYSLVYDKAQKTVSLKDLSEKPVEPLTRLFLYNDQKAAQQLSLVKDNYFTSVNAYPVKAGGWFYFAEKINSKGEIDWSGRVWGTKDGKIGLIQEGGDPIPVDPCYSDREPLGVGFDADACEVIYRCSVNINGMTAVSANGIRNLWVQPLPHHCEFYIEGADGRKISEMLDKSVFDNFNDQNCSARYTGRSARYEIHYRPDPGWMMFRCLDAGHQFYLIGNNAAFGQVPYMAYPMIDTDLDKIAGHYIPFNRLTDDIYSATIYLDNGSSFQLYSDFRWAAQMTTWTSVTPEIFDRIQGGGFSAPGASFKPGLYVIKYNYTDNTVTLIAQ